jgi:hypothetical protein
MFSFLSAEGSMALRLPEERRKEFLEKHGTSLFVAHGAILKEYVEVPERLFKNTFALLPYVDQSYEYVRSLKPKKEGEAGGSRKKRAGK